VGGYTFKFMGLDDQGSSANAAADYQQLVHQDHVTIIVIDDDSPFIGAASTMIGTGVPVIGGQYVPPRYQNAGM
jgi:hypothetical protein